MTLDQLYYFRKLAELQYFSKAANELYISQPSLSYSIKKLEKELGTTLFQKSGRNVVLTKHGKDFYKCVVDVLTRLEDGVAMLRQSIADESGKISIAVLPVVPGDFIPKNVRSFIGLYPNIQFDIFTCIENKQIIDGLNDGTYDIGFCHKVLNESELTFVPVIKNQLVVVAKSDSNLFKKEKLTISDLRKLPLITYRESNPIGLFIRSLFTEQNIVPNIVFSFDEEMTITEMVTEDFGVAVLADKPILHSYLSVIPLDIQTEPPVLYLAYHKNSHHSANTYNFIRHIITNTEAIDTAFINI